MKIKNYQNPHASKQNPLVNSWDLMYLVRQVKIDKQDMRHGDDFKKSFQGRNFDDVQ